MNGPAGPVPDDIRRLAERRARAREAKDFARADALREAIAEAGWTVVDEPGGWRLEPAADPTPAAMRAHDVPTRLEEPTSFDVSVHWVCEGWPGDIERAVASFRRHHAGRPIQCVVADVTGAAHGSFGSDVEVISLQPGTGWGAARNAGLIRSTGAVVLAMDASIEIAGDVMAPIEDVLADQAVGLAGPFGIVTHDLRRFEEAPGPGDCDAIEGYAMAFRRGLLTEVGLIDERFRWYRSADIEFSFRVKDAGFRTVMVPMPVIKHEHRQWTETPAADRDRLSKRNYYRFLERWRDRWDLVLDPHPPEADTGRRS